MKTAALFLISLSACAQQPLKRVQPQLIMSQSEVPYKPVACHDPKNHSSDPLFQSLPPFNDNGPMWLPLSEGKRADLMHQRDEWAKGTDAVSVCYVAGITRLLEAK